MDPLEEHVPAYLQFMDEHKLRIRAVLLTSDERDFLDFYRDLAPISRAFTEDFAVHAGFR